MTPEKQKEIEKFIHMAEVIASEPYPNPEAAVVHLINAVKLLFKELKNASD